LVLTGVWFIDVTRFGGWFDLDICVHVASQNLDILVWTCAV